MIETRKLYSLNDVCIVPTEITSIKSRSECDCKVPNIEGTRIGFLPVIAAPMSCVMKNESDYLEFWNSGVSCVIPRTIPLEKRLELCKTVFCGFSLGEAKDVIMKLPSNSVINVCLDIANGHMVEQFKIGRDLRNHFGDSLRLMGGNIANPETYMHYEVSGFDFVRVSVGSGSGCLSSTQTAIHYPMASLLDDINERYIKGYKNRRCRIIADGGMTGYSDIIKALALGADYVMAGLIFAKAAKGKELVGDSLEYYGMSTKRAQKEMGKTELKTSEGKFLSIQKEYTLQGWVENFDSYLRSSMSYCDSKSLEEFRKNARFNVVSNETIKNITKK